MTFPDTERYYVCWKIRDGNVTRYPEDEQGYTHAEALAMWMSINANSMASMYCWIENAAGERIPEEAAE